jgi:hypothetical protein
LDLLFSLAKELRYNFARFAEASFKGLTDSILLKAQMSDSKSGSLNPMSPRGGMDVLELTIQCMDVLEPIIQCMVNPENYLQYLYKLMFILQLITN